MAEKEYVRLTRFRRRRGRFFESITRYSSLWLGSDHLLSIDSNRLSEEYKRFYFRDIQSIAIVKTKRRERWNVVLVVLALGVVLGLANGSTTAAAILPAIVIGSLLLLNNLLGSTSTVFLRTAVQVEELPSLSRVRRANRMLDRIRPLIAGAQGEITSEEATMRNRELFELSGGQTRVITSPLNLSS